MNPVAKNMDPVTGVDNHLIIPPASPPIPVPHPYVGMLFDPVDFIPVAGANVFTGAMPRAIAGTSGMATVPHMPIGGAFAPPPPSNESELFMGSSTVSFQGDACGYAGLPVLSCQSVGTPAPPRKWKKSPAKSMFLPTSVINPIPSSVLISGAPIVSLPGAGSKLAGNSLAKAFKKFGKKGSKLWKKASDVAHARAEKLMAKMGITSPSIKNRVHKSICTVTGHPVDVATGKLFTDLIDFELPGPIPLKWERTWYSSSGYKGPLGHGWHHEYDQGIILTDKTIIYRTPDGRYTGFPHLKIGESSWNDIERLTLKRTANETYEISSDEDQTFIFDQSGTPRQKTTIGSLEIPLTEIRDRNQNKITFQYSKFGLSKIIDSSGRELKVELDNFDRLSKIKIDNPDPKDHQNQLTLVSYEYDSKEDLVAVNDVYNVPFRYQYFNHLLVEETDRNGLKFYFSFDDIDKGISAKCIKTWGDGDIIYREIDYNEEEMSSIVTDSRGAKSEYFSNHQGLVYRKIDPLGRWFLTEWSDDNQKKLEKLPSGEEVTYDYDKKGRLTGKSSSFIGETQFEYTETGDIKKAISPDGGQWQREQDPRGNIVSTTDPLLFKKSYSYDEQGNPITLVDTKGSETNLQWDKCGNLKEIRSPKGNTTKFQYDSWGRTTSKIDAEGNKEQYFWDKLSRLVKHIDGEGNESNYRYDKEDNLIAHTDPLGRRSLFEYGPMGVLTAGTSPSGKKSKKEYDRELDLEKVLDGRDKKWRFKRDIIGRIEEETSFDNRTQKYSWDHNDQIVKSESPTGIKTNYQRTKEGYLSKITYDDKDCELQESFQYDTFGRLLLAENKDSKVEYQYDLLGQTISESLNGKKLESYFDGEGNRILRRSHYGKEIHFKYDEENSLKEILDSKKSLLTFGLDGIGREIKKILPGGISIDKDYLATGELRKSIISKNRINQDTREYSWNAAGELKDINDSKRGEYKFDYDLDSRLKKAFYPDKKIEEFNVDIGGNVPAIPEGISNGIGDKEVTWVDGFELHWNKEGQLIAKVSASVLYQYQYDKAARMCKAYKKKLDGYGIKGLEPWPKDPKLLSNKETLSEYKYDPLGRRTEKKVYKVGGSRTTTKFYWDGDYLISEEEIPQIGFPAISEYIYQPNSFEVLAQLNIENSDKDFFIHSDHISTPISAYNSNGSEVWSASYRAYGKKYEESGLKNLVKIRFQGQYEDEETGLYYNRFRYYDPDLKRYTQSDPIGLAGGLQNWNYVDDPNGWVDPFGLSKKRCGEVGLDNNALVNAIEGDGEAIEAMGGRTPVLSPTVIKEFLRGSKNQREKFGNVKTRSINKVKLRIFLKEYNGRVGAFSSAQGRSEAIDAGAKRTNRNIRSRSAGDPGVISSSINDDINLLTRDKTLLNNFEFTEEF